MQPAPIYNSRNSKDLIVGAPIAAIILLIYNSRNSKDLIVRARARWNKAIYNSRNSKDLIVLKTNQPNNFDLQQ